ncbi:(2Fe-2S)-binding protein [Streptomyces sp. 8L]|uniref:(2Fe-2S)-binding protein n=1 Tax=Streptomyces sp. 8L TaxID=2877242 RepID=UPI001CD469B9|nr:(2Fe-2S)-binding protein [Streptomyces sp. 8L]MCA1218293.1 (2Fe-2S)-binding protein [Streptomyces sp. 8L]
MPLSRTTALLDALAGYGPFFGCESHAPESAVAGPWFPMRVLADDPDALWRRVRAVRERLAARRGLAPDDFEHRVAVSVCHLGFAARLVSPVLALAALHDLPLALDLDTLRMCPTAGGTFPLSLPRDALNGPGVGQAEAAEALVAGALGELGEAFAALSVSRHTLWGNVASAVGGAVTSLVAAEPAQAGRIRAAGAVLLARPELAGTFTAAPDGAFRRRSCCLYYRTAPRAARASAVCGDCVLA